jgi:hypothetical protein
MSMMNYYMKTVSALLKEIIQNYDMANHNKCIQKFTLISGKGKNCLRLHKTTKHHDRLIFRTIN